MTADPLLDVLRTSWGFTTFRPLQRDAMQAVIDGRDSLLVMPTGGGKSLCFQAPALVRAGLALVVSPLIALMKDQVDTLLANDISTACYNSALSSDAKAGARHGLRKDAFVCYTDPDAEAPRLIVKSLGRQRTS